MTLSPRFNHQESCDVRPGQSEPTEPDMTQTHVSRIESAGLPYRLDMKAFPTFSMIARTVLVFVLFFTLYSTTVSRVLCASHDSVSYLNEIDAGVNLFHPHHLLYNFISRMWLEACRAIGIQSDSMLLVPLLNGMFGAGTLAMVYLILRFRAGVPDPTAFLATSSIGFLYGFWFYSSCVEVYMIPLFFMICTLFLLSGPALSSPLVGIAGLSSSLAILSHQAHVLFLACGLTMIAAQYTRARRLGIRHAAIYLATVAMLVGIAYIGIPILVQGLSSPLEAWRWATGYARNDQYWNDLSIRTLLMACIGFSHSFVGGQFLFRVKPIESNLRVLLPERTLSDEAYLVRDMSSGQALALVGLTAVLAMLLAIAVGVACLNFRNSARRNCVILSGLAAFLTAYAGFFFFYEPQNLEFWIPQSVGFMIMLFILWPIQCPSLAGFRLLPILALGISVCLFTINYLGSIRFLTNPSNDLFLSRVEPLRRSCRSTDLLVLGDPWIIEAYIHRHVPVAVTSSQGRSVLFIRDAVIRTVERGGEVYVAEDAIPVGTESQIRFPLSYEISSRKVSLGGVRYLVFGSKADIHQGT